MLSVKLWDKIIFLNNNNYVRNDKEHSCYELICVPPKFMLKSSLVSQCDHLECL